jgi:hypothetical protein
MLVYEQHPPRWSSGEVKCSACSREEGTLQRLGEKVSFLVCSAALGESDMSCLDLLLKIFVLDVEMLAQFCHAVGVCDIDASLVVEDLPCAAELLEPGEIPGGDVGGDKFSHCG